MSQRVSDDTLARIAERQDVEPKGALFDLRDVCADLWAARAELKELRDALRRLANEASASSQYLSGQDAGATNRAVLALRIDEARALLAKGGEGEKSDAKS